MTLKYELKRLDLQHPWTIARGTSNSKENVFLSLEKDGIVGFGEAAPNVRYKETAESTMAVFEQARPVIEASDLRNFHDLNQKLRLLFPKAASATTAIDMAVLDWFCKSLNLPLYRYFGLNKANTPVTTYSIGIDEPDKIQQKVKEAGAFPILKIKLGLGDDEKMMASIRAVTNKPLRVDANEGWATREEALEKIKWLQTCGVEFVEQPMPASQLDDMAWVRERSPLPLLADESVMSTSDIPTLARAFDGINIKLMKAGGILESLKMIWLAKSLGMQVMLGCMVESSLAISAAASLSPLVDYADLDGNLLISNDPFTGVQVEAGRLRLSEKPGVGAELL